MNTVVIPNEVRIIGLLVDNITFDVFDINNQAISPVLFASVNKRYIDNNLLHVLGRMQITILKRTFHRYVLNGGVKIPQDWILLLIKHIRDCYEGMYSINRLMQPYLKKNLCDLDIIEINDKMIKETKNGNYMIAQAVMFELLAAKHNPYNRAKFKATCESKGICPTNFELNNDDYVKTRFLQNNFKTTYNLIFDDISPGIHYHIPITYDTSSNRHETLINPVIVFVEYTFDKQVIERALQVLESIMFVHDLNKSKETSTGKFLIEAWYTIFKTAYEQQKDKSSIIIIQPYLPYMFASLELVMRNVETTLTAYDTSHVTHIMPYILMPVAMCIQVLHSVHEHDILRFVDFLSKLEGTCCKVKAFFETQLICAYYSPFLSEMFDRLISRTKSDSEELLLFEVLLRILLSLPLSCMFRMSEDELYRFRNYYKQLRLHLTERHILPIPNLVYTHKMLSKNTIHCKTTNHLAYLYFKMLEIPTNQNYVFLEIDLLENVPPICRQILGENPYSLTVYIVPAKVR